MKKSLSLLAMLISIGSFAYANGESTAPGDPKKQPTQGTPAKNTSFGVTNSTFSFFDFFIFSTPVPDTTKVQPKPAPIVKEGANGKN